VALGNAPKSDGVVNALKDKLNIESDLVREHVEWALKKLSSLSHHPGPAK